MYGYALRHPKKCASNDIINDQGLTPLTLACRLGRASVFKEMLELSCKEFWRYSNITCSAYPLNALDTILPDGKTNWNSALFMILAGSKEEHLDMLDGGIIQRLLEEKWKTFAQRQFLKRITIAFIHLCSMSVAVYLRPKDRGHALTTLLDAQDVVRTVFEVCTICGCLSFVLIQQGEEIKNQGLVSFLKQLVSQRLRHACAKLKCAFFIPAPRSTEGAIFGGKSPNPDLHPVSSEWRRGHGRKFASFHHGFLLVLYDVLCRVSIWLLSW